MVRGEEGGGEGREEGEGRRVRGRVKQMVGGWTVLGGGGRMGWETRAESGRRGDGWEGVGGGGRTGLERWGLGGGDGGEREGVREGGMVGGGCLKNASILSLAWVASLTLSQSLHLSSSHIHSRRVRGVRLSCFISETSSTVESLKSKVGNSMQSYFSLVFCV